MAIREQTGTAPVPDPDVSPDPMSRRSVLRGAAAAGAAGLAVTALGGVPAMAATSRPGRGRLPQPPRVRRTASLPVMKRSWYTSAMCAAARWTCIAAPAMSECPTRTWQRGWPVPARAGHSPRDPRGKT